MSQLIDPKKPIRVQGTPSASITNIAWDHTETAQEKVDCHRVDNGWWSIPISRTDLVARSPTALLEIVHDVLAGEWFLQRIIE